MSIEWVSTIGSLLTVLIVGATAIAALVQLRHMRAGNQINAILTIGEKFMEPRYEDARALVTAGLDDALQDPRFREHVIARVSRNAIPGIPEQYLAMLRAVNLVGNMFEEIGNLVKNGIVDEYLLLDEYVTQVIAMWNRLEPYTALTRDVTGDMGLWDNFEYLTVRARAFIAAHPTTYPKGVARIPLTNRWPQEKR
jgi:hypothetical protein